MYNYAKTVFVKPRIEGFRCNVIVFIETILRLAERKG